MIREVVIIDEEKCNGCGDCVPACAEGAIQIIDGKAKLLADNLCDGLGACLGHCPMDAIHIEKRDADEFDEELVNKHLKDIGREPLPDHGQVPATPVTAPPQGGCPGSRMMNFDKPATNAGAEVEETGSRQSQLRQWPVQMTLVPPTAPFFQDAELLIAADCVPFAHADFHKEMLKDKALLIGCPKLDDGQSYVDKLTAILQHNNIKKLIVARMEVPCCGGLTQIAQVALKASGKDIPFEIVTVSIQGDIK